MDQGIERSNVSSLDFDYQLESEICELCVNNCDLRVYKVNGKKTAWGLKCGREYEDQKVEP
jgi:hypothetical protein